MNEHNLDEKYVWSRKCDVPDCEENTENYRLANGLRKEEATPEALELWYVSNYPGYSGKLVCKICWQVLRNK